MKHLLLILIFISSFLTLYFDISQADAPILSSETLFSEALSSGKTPRIIGGRNADPEDWPWMAALVYSSSYSNSSGQFCGGSLIHPLWVVSAGHCGYKYRNNPGEIEIIIGINDLTDDNAERIGVKQIVIHKDYDDNSLYSDIALFELEKPVFTKTIPIISDDIELEGMDAKVIGWGATYLEKTTILQEVSVPIISNLDCNNAFIANNSYWYPPDIEHVTDNMLCAGLSEGGKDACQGDSGGPLMVWHENKWNLAGMVSWGEGCAMPDVYGVYSRVSKFFDFINKYVPPYPPGDFNEDKRLGLEDIIGILQNLASAGPESSGSVIHGDFNNDDRLGLEDAVGVLQIITDSYN
ncbi:serine protease [Desulfobacterales bacterium HSG17]|nr:serine protease [Desulfobacterales bacterium HSG17]